MSQSLDDKLRAALKPLDPGEDFTQRVMARLTEADRTKLAPAEFHRRRFGVRARWASVAVAASVVLAIANGIRIYEQHEREAGLRARAQLLEALQVTSEKLNLAVRVVHGRSERAVTDSGV